jgi:type IV secretory pathway TrbD component
VASRYPVNLKPEAQMAIERETIVERPTSSETVVVGGGSPFGIIGGIIAAIFAVLLILWLVNGGLTSNGDAVNVDLPNVTVTE